MSSTDTATTPPRLAPPDQDDPRLARGLRTSSSGTFSRLLRFAIANIRRRPERFLFSALGIALAITSVTVVRTIAASYAHTGSVAVAPAIDGADEWVVPASGVRYLPAVGVLVGEGPAPALKVGRGWSVDRVVTGLWKTPEGSFAVYGRADFPAGRAIVSPAAASALGVRAGGSLDFHGTSLKVAEGGSGRLIIVSYGLARSVVGTDGWLDVSPPGSDRGRHDLGSLLSRTSGLPWTTDPASRPASGGRGLIYDTVGSSSLISFSQQFAAEFSGKVTTSTLGLVSTVGLVLGFVIAVSSFLASVQERRREFGIMSSIGLADEVLYFFLVESAVVFLAAYLGGIALAALAVAVVIPHIATVSAWAQAAGTVAAYLPAMAIVGALIPVHRLLQQRPVALLSASH